MALVTLYVALVTPSLAQSPSADQDSGAQSPEASHGFPTDWSSRFVVMTGEDPAAALAAGVNEPRHVYNLVRRMVAIDNARRQAATPRRQPVKIDWAVSLENGFVPQNQYPAKFQFTVSGQDCNKDYVLFGLTVNAGTQANLVGINNLYTGGTGVGGTSKCNNGVQWVAFAYNTVTHSGGQIRTSPTLSAKGTLVAFVESTTTGSFFHVLVLPNPIPTPPSQVGTVLVPHTPSSCTTPTTANCMTTLQISAAATTDSSPWIDYNTDTAYVGADDGFLYKITPVFGGGAPKLVNDAANWPVKVVTAGTSKVLTDPIVDPNSGRIFLGDANGYLYAVSLKNPAKVTAARVTIGWAGHGAGTGIVDPPILVNDLSNPAVDQVFAFTGCSNLVGIGGAVNQLPATFTSSSRFTAVDLGSADGQGTCTTANVHAGTFDNSFFVGGSAAGHIMACGFVSGTTSQPRVPSNPKMYKFSFNGSHLIASPPSSTWVVNNTLGDECSPLSEFFDGTADRMFFGVGKTDGFIEASRITAGVPAPPTCGASPTATCVKAPSALGGTSGVIVDNQVSNGGTNIYFSTLAPGSVNAQNCQVTGGAATPYCAVKLTQSGLQ
jgi:hypothetical protein